MIKHLWEHEHSYYWNEGCFHERGHHFRYDCWADFLKDRDDADPDLNLLARWDWRIETDDAEKQVGPEGSGLLMLYYVVQRKGFTQSCEVRVTGEEESAIREWLKSKAEHMRALWQPLLEAAS